MNLKSINSIQDAICVISVFRCEVAEKCTLLGNNPEECCVKLSTFRFRTYTQFSVSIFRYVRSALFWYVTRRRFHFPTFREKPSVP